MKTVLVVDDNKCIRDALFLALTSHLVGYTVRTAHDGVRAKEIFDSSAVSAIITDLAMPGMNGYQLMEHVRARSRRTPIIAMSARAGRDVDERLRPLGVVRLFEKPFDIFDIAQTVASALALPETMPAQHEPARDLSA